MKRQYICLIIILSSLLNACNANTEDDSVQENSSVSTVDLNTTSSALNMDFSVASSESETSKSANNSYETSGLMTINVFEKGEAVGYRLKPGEEKKHELTVRWYRENVYNDQNKNIPVFLYLIEDGQPISFFADGKEMTGANQLEFPLGVEYDLPIEFELSEDFHSLSVVSFDLSDADGFYGSVYANIYTMFNSEANWEDFDVENYTNETRIEMSKEKNWGMGLSDVGVTMGPTDFCFPGLQTIIEIDKNTEGENLFIQMGNSDVFNDKYYMFLFCEGRMLFPFNGKPSFIADCTENCYAYEYPVTGVLEKGVHGYHVLALQAVPDRDDPLRQEYYVSRLFKVDLR